ncbi:hypothetical protein Pint_10890 [Pistacia integerrima]|uniref:Uncharacterized protein n=1 Tax=Pistacia integerrima TaxID=434235 RepID=A0ACC0XGN8_9ROSI|nr:hypothetical protein Pint_10890 [Pistacia integerrima]
MNRETDRELKAYCLAFDDGLGPPPAVDVKSLTHYGEPYHGNSTRLFRSTLFAAVVRSCYRESCLLHGVEWMPLSDTMKNSNDFAGFDPSIPASDLDIGNNTNALNSRVTAENVSTLDGFANKVSFSLSLSVTKLSQDCNVVLCV